MSAPIKAENVPIVNNLTPLERAVFQIMNSRPGHMVSLTDLAEAWPPGLMLGRGWEHCVYQIIYTLRHKLALEVPGYRIDSGLHTGYFLLAPNQNPERALALLSEGNSKDEVARLLGVDRAIVWKWTNQQRKQAA